MPEGSDGSNERGIVDSKLVEQESKILADKDHMMDVVWNFTKS